MDQVYEVSTCIVAFEGLCSFLSSLVLHRNSKILPSYSLSLPSEKGRTQVENVLKVLESEMEYKDKFADMGSLPKT